MIMLQHVTWQKSIHTETKAANYVHYFTMNSNYSMNIIVGKFEAASEDMVRMYYCDSISTKKIVFLWVYWIQPGVILQHNI